ncbi:MAG: LegC family aminotransferase [Alphaproteobacteria bacterium]|nr:LegC family aminotransferase [Alphaproteobacteria bacterium]
MTTPLQSASVESARPNAYALEVVDRICRALPPGTTGAALHEPSFTGREREYLVDCIDTGWVSYAGAYVERFEQRLARACDVPYAVAVCSGTVALQVALVVSGLKPGEEVILPALTFVASANAVVHAGGVPHFVDVDETTLGIDPAALDAHLARIADRRAGELINRESGRRIFGLLPVHVFGHPVDFDPMLDVAKRYGLFVVEDATEALGSRYKEKACGSLAPVATLSFNGNKIVTSGGGGAILTGDREIARRTHHLTTTAKLPHRWAFNHDEIGWNYRLPNVNAALGLAQLERLAPMLDAKKRLWRRYADAFSGLGGARIFSDASFADSNRWLIALILDRGNEPMLEPILSATNDAGLKTRPAWTPLHQLPMYADNPTAPLPVTESLAQRIVCLPSSPFLASA